MGEENGQGVPAPQPVPMSIMCQAARTPDGRSLVMLSLFSATGVQVAFFDPDGAESLAQMLQAQAATARSGLVIPESSEVAHFANRAERRRMEREA